MHYRTIEIILFVIIFHKEMFMLQGEEIRIQSNGTNHIVEHINKTVFSSLAQTKLATSPSNLRSNRQIHYNPQVFYIQNYVNQKSECSVTYEDQKAICVPYYKCPKQHQNQQQDQNKQQFILNEESQNYDNLSSILYWPTYQYEICTYTNRYKKISTGICCPLSEVKMEIEENMDKYPINIDDLDRSKDDNDSEILESTESFNNNIEPNENNTQDNNIDYDPITEWRRDVGKMYVAASYWPFPFWSFASPPQWPSSLPTLLPAIDNWPPQLPTHPPNHHYPTHPSTKPQYTTTRPSYDFTTKRVTTVKPSRITTRRPSYYPGNYPFIIATTTTSKPLMNNGDDYGLTTQCGHRNAPTKDQERIVGGSNASPHEFPWMAVMFRAGRQFCGGSLITNNHILTAAHCVARFNSWDVSTITVHLGDYNIRTDFEVKHITRRIKRLIRHKGFDFSHLHNDISILVLNEPVQFSYEIQPLCLPNTGTLQSRTFSGQVGLVAGWGSLRESGPQPSILQKVQVPIWTNSECAQKYGRAAPGGIISSMICAGQAQKDSCTGDSGGPMVVKEGGRYFQVGIVSWGIGCGKGQYPGVYTRVTSLLPWIYKNLKLIIN